MSCLRCTENSIVINIIMENHMRIGPHEIGEGLPVFVIAEIGINHNGSVDLAKKLIDAAVLAGCQAVKFQKRTVDKVYTKEELDKPRESPWGNTNRDQKLGLEFSPVQYDEIDRYCADKDILWFASPWDEDSVDFLEAFDIPCYKVPSACVTDLSLLRRINKTGKPVIVSTGMTEKTHLINAAAALYEVPTAWLACTSTYPCKPEDLNLLKINSLKAVFPNDVIGYSGHEVGLWSTLCAVAMGAQIIERHITLDRAMYGSDQAASVEPAGFMKLVKEIRDFEKAKGHGRIEILNSEMPILEKLRRFK